MSRWFDLIKGVSWKILEERGNIKVVTNGRKTLMKFGSTTYSVLDAKTIYTHSYFDYFIPLAYIYENPTVLVIGLGGGTIPNQLSKLFGDKITLESVDNNKDVIELAKRYFIDKDCVTVYLSDGNEFVSKCKGKYNLIVLDVFEGLRTPNKFFDEEFIKNSKEALREDGILAINVILDDGSLWAYIEKLKKEFNVYHFSPYAFSFNTIIVCTKGLSKQETLEKIKANMKTTSKNRFLLNTYEKLLGI